MLKTIQFSQIFNDGFVKYVKTHFNNARIVIKNELKYIIFTNSNFITIMEIKNSFIKDIYYNFLHNLIPVARNETKFSEIYDEIKNIIYIVYLWGFHYILD